MLNDIFTPPTTPLLNEETTETKAVKLGVVADCAKLNVRKEPDVSAEILCEIPHKSEVLIDEAGAAGDFYAICTEAGIEGFCMKKYITVRE